MIWVMKKLSSSFFDRNTVVVARDMIGKMLVHESSDGILAGIIKETEAYTQEDPASHSYLGKKTKRNLAMFESPGTLYIYMIYGLHYCFNFVCEKKGVGCAVLIRDVVPLHGIDSMKKNRHVAVNQLANGPAKLVQAFGISAVMNLLPYHKSPIYIAQTNDINYFSSINSYSRIGISKGCDLLWRFRGQY